MELFRIYDDNRLLVNELKYILNAYIISDEAKLIGMLLMSDTHMTENEMLY